MLQIIIYADNNWYYNIFVNLYWEVDPNIALCGSEMTALHLAALHNSKNTDCIQLLLESMSVTFINWINTAGCTAMDFVYELHQYKNPIKYKILHLMRKYGAKANCYRSCIFSSRCYITLNLTRLLSYWCYTIIFRTVQ
jgi:hypothetical protein